MTTLDLASILAQRRNLRRTYDDRVTRNAATLQGVQINRRRSLEDLTRAFDRGAGAFNRSFTRSGLETSGLRIRATDMRNADQLRNLNRTREAFDRQSSSIALDNQQAAFALEDGLADIESQRAAHAQSIAQQIRSNT